MRTTLIRYATSLLLLLGLTALPGSASTPNAPTLANFGGAWKVNACDRANPTLDCGVFDVRLIQEGERLCGDFGGALIKLRQIDAGRLEGLVVGDTALLTLRSNRNGSIHFVRAELRGDALNWKVVDRIRKPDNNHIDIIASDDVLQRGAPPPMPTCRELTGK